MVISIEEYKTRKNFVMVDKRIMSDGNLPSRDKAIYLSLCGYMNRTSRTCYPSHKKIMTDTGFSKSTVIRGLHNLERKGYIKISKRFDVETGRNISNLYQFL